MVYDCYIEKREIVLIKVKAELKNFTTIAILNHVGWYLISFPVTLMHGFIFRFDGSPVTSLNLFFK